MCRALGYCWPLKRQPRVRMKSFTWYTSNSSEVNENRKVGSSPNIRSSGWELTAACIAALVSKICWA